MSEDKVGPKRTPRPSANQPAASPGAQASTGADEPKTPIGFVQTPTPGAPTGSTATIAAPAATDPAASTPPLSPAPTTSTTPVVSATPSGSQASKQPTTKKAAAKTKPSGKARRRGRRVTRVVRRIDLWSVLKLSLAVYACLYLAVLMTLAALWGLAYSSGMIDNLQSFLEDVGLEDFTFYGDQMFKAAAAIGAVGVVAGTIITVLATALINVISEVSGGIRLVVIEEEF